MAADADVMTTATAAAANLYVVCVHNPKIKTGPPGPVLHFHTNSSNFEYIVIKYKKASGCICMELHSNPDTTNEKIASFDCTYTSNHIRMLKILLYYIPKNFKKHLAFYIKFLELQQVLSAPSVKSPSLFMQQAFHSEQSETSFEETDPYNRISAMIEELLPFCTVSESEKFRSIGQFVSSFEQIKNMMEMFEMMKDMKDMFGDGEGGFDPDMFSGMMNGMMGGMDGFNFSDIFSGN